MTSPAAMHFGVFYLLILLVEANGGSGRYWFKNQNTFRHTVTLEPGTPLEHGAAFRVRLATNFPPGLNVSYGRVQVRLIKAYDAIGKPMLVGATPKPSLSRSPTTSSQPRQGPTTHNDPSWKPPPFFTPPPRHFASATKTRTLLTRGKHQPTSRLPVTMGSPATSHPLDSGLKSTMTITLRSRGQPLNYPQQR